jgi:CheY-like chemotaxis protein
MIEDDLDMHYLYKRVFHNLHLEDRLKLFDNATDALSFLQQASNETEVILSDINMPVVSGIDLKKKINEDSVLNSYHIPFVFLSTSATEIDVRKSTDLNVQGFFRKGETLDDLQHTIEMVHNYWATSILP